MRNLFLPLFLVTAILPVNSHSQDTPYVKLCGVENIEFPTGTKKKFEPLVDDAAAGEVAIKLGEDASITEMPGLVKLRSYTFLAEIDGNVARAASDDCAATRIHKDYLITAAHCVDDVEVAFSLFYGVSNTKSSRRGVARVNTVLCHRGYEQINHLHNDIALIDISSPQLADLRNLIDIVDIVNVEDHAEKDLIVTGWGSETPFDDSNLLKSNRLKKGTMKIDWVGPSNIVAVPKSGAICSGDSGGPVYVDVGGDKKLVGVVSAQLTPKGQLQCEQANRGVFTNVASYQNWIENIINNPIEDADIVGFRAMKKEQISSASEAEKKDAKLAIGKYVNSHDFKAFSEDVYKEPWPEGLYIVNGDVPISDLKGLVNFYLGMVAEDDPDDDRYAIRRIKSYDVNGIGSEDDDIWTNIEKTSITYCVSHKFDGKYEDIRRAMDNATVSWEQAADVDFIEKVLPKGSCNNRNEDVVFNVSPVDVDGAYWARAFFPSYYRNSRAKAALNIDKIAMDLPVDDEGNFNLSGLLRHELHHILGGRHEHIRPENGLCHESSNWRGITDYDGYSVSNYPQCGGLGDRAMRLSELDKQGVACIYGPAVGFSFDPMKYGIDPKTCYKPN